MNVRAVSANELGDVARFIASEQTDPAHSTSFLVGDNPERIRAELDALEPAWQTTVRVVHASDGSIAGAVLVEVDEHIGRAYLFGPWVAGDAWDALAPQLFDAALAQVPDTVDEVELVAMLANTRLQEFASSRGWHRSSEHHALDVQPEIVAAWPEPAANVRLATTEDLAAIGPLHDAAFPNTHTPTDRLLDKMTVLVATDSGVVVGYIAGQVQADGEGYIDYLAVDPARRGEGTGKKLVMALAKPLLELSPLDIVALTVNGENAPARALYASLGFETAASFVAYRSWE